MQVQREIEAVDRQLADLAAQADRPPPAPYPVDADPEEPEPSLSDPVPQGGKLNDFVLWVIARSEVFDYGHWAAVRFGADTPRNRKALRRCFNYLQNKRRVHRTGPRSWEALDPISSR
jgi:hypothetical protein